MKYILSVCQSNYCMYGILSVTEHILNSAFDQLKSFGINNELKWSTLFMVLLRKVEHFRHFSNLIKFASLYIEIQPYQLAWRKR